MKTNEKLCATQVKTRRDIGGDKGWHMKPKHESMVAEDLFYVFVDVGKQPSDPTVSYILPSSVVANRIRDCHRVWLGTPGKGGKQHKDSNVRRLLPDYSNIKPNTEEGRKTIARYASDWLESCRENWSIPGLPEADGF